MLTYNALNKNTVQNEMNYEVLNSVQKRQNMKIIKNAKSKSRARSSINHSIGRYDN